MRQSLVVSVMALGMMVVAAGRTASSPTPSTDAAPASPVVQAQPVSAAPGRAAKPVTVKAHDGRSFEVAPEIAGRVQALLDHAAADGIVLGGSGLRSHQRQHELRKINGCPDGWTHSEDENPELWAPASSCRVPTARPGFSNHESGKAIDFTYRGSVIGSRSSAAFRWLAANAARYGLKNLPSEPWHWSVNGN